jgi:hypothetical protein
MKKNIFVFAITIFGSVTLFFFYMFIKRINLPYNSEGNYFAESELVTYQIQSAEVYGIISFVFLIVTGILFYKIWLNKKMGRYNR